MSDEPDIRFGLMTLLAFVRLATDQRVFDRPLETARAIEIVESWLARANVSVAQPSQRHWAALAAHSTMAKVRGALVMDAHLATLTIEHGARLATTDRDFTRFPGLRMTQPAESLRWRKLLPIRGLAELPVAGLA